MKVTGHVDIPKKPEDIPLTSYTECLTSWYTDKTTSEYRKTRGQFFTPRKTSEFMVRQICGFNNKRSMKILDPGAGIGILESALCEFLISQKKIKKTFFDLYENDENILPLLKANMDQCKESMNRKGLDMSYRIYGEDFVLSKAPIFEELNDFDLGNDGYDLVISNPPYYKLKKESPQTAGMRSIIRGQPNIYIMFMTLSAMLLKNGGQMTVLTPRSYCSGVYFKNFRKWFFRNVNPIKIHVFESRNKVFKRYNVRQEMVILTAVKCPNVPKKVIISTSKGEPELNEIRIRETDYEKIIIENNDDLTMRIPLSELDESAGALIEKLKFKLADLGLKVSTGPVVPFRAKEYLLSDINKESYAPLIWMENIANGRIIWPISKNNKSIAIKDKKKSRKLLIASGNYVLVKRFSSKEGKRRLNAGVLLGKSLVSDYIGIENHVNYIYKVNGTLTEDEAYGIMGLLNSQLYNRYFQMANGSTQVNAADISNIPLPSLEEINVIGNLIRKKKEKDEIKSEKIILDKLNIPEPSF